MGKIYEGIKRIFEKQDRLYSYPLIEKFIVLVTFENTYLMKKLIYNPDKTIHFRLSMNGKDMFIDCGNFGILVSPDDRVSIHT